MRKLSDFFILCSGVHRELLNRCTSERNKFGGLGAAIFFTGLFAFLSASFAFYTVFDGYLISIVLGLIWGLMIFNLDRYIVSSMRKEGKPGKEVVAALPRLLVAVVISVVIAKPLELKIFDKEIAPELVVMEQQAFARQEAQVKERFREQESQLQGEIASLQLQINEKEKRRDELDRLAQEEADGTGGSRRRNLGPIYQLKKQDAEKAAEEALAIKTLNREKMTVLETRMALNDSIRQAELRGLEFTPRNGIAARMEALSHVKESSAPIAMASLFIMLLLIVLETVPVLVKLISPRGPYDNLLRAEEFKFETIETQEMASSSATVREKTDGLPIEEKTFVRDRLDEALKKG